MDDRLALWIARCLIEVLDGRALQFEFEPGGGSADSVGFLLVRPDVREYHQVLEGPAPGAARVFWRRQERSSKVARINFIWSPQLGLPLSRFWRRTRGGPRISQFSGPGDTAVASKSGWTW